MAANSQDVTKPIHTILLDTSPILLNTPSISTLIANSHELVTTEAVIAEIKGEEARNRFDTLYRPFLTIRSPKPESIKFVREFARRTGDSGVLSTTDFEVLALAYDLECERNGGDWRLRRVPGQKRVNGSPPTKEVGNQTNEAQSEELKEESNLEEQLAGVTLEGSEAQRNDPREISIPEETSDEQKVTAEAQSDAPINVSETSEPDTEQQDATTEPEVVEIVEEPISESEEDGWITPSNIKRHQAKDEAGSNSTQNETRILQVATMTGDFAMQNVLLQMNLNLLSTKTCKRVAHIKQMILRCHGCFATTKDMAKQFCPRCGKPTLTRVTCTTNDKGEVKLHLKANHQWNNRGNVFSIPKPTAGTANQKWKGPRQGGGAGGWGSGLILAEDQKEYVRAMSTNKRTKNKDLMDEDMLPSILTGERNQAGGRIKVGAGRAVNSRKR